MGTFTASKRHVLHTFATTHKPADEETGFAVHAQHRMPGFCHGKRLRTETLSVTFAGLDIADLSRLPLKGCRHPRPFAERRAVKQDQQEPNIRKKQL